VTFWATTRIARSRVTVSRMRAFGFSKARPYQQAIMFEVEVPRPSTKRPGARRSAATTPVASTRGGAIEDRHYAGAEADLPRRHAERRRERDRILQPLAVGEPEIVVTGFLRPRPPFKPASSSGAGQSMRPIRFFRRVWGRESCPTSSVKPSA
jgi:hypothetical protein